MSKHGYYQVDIQSLGATVQFQLSSKNTGYSQQFTASSASFSPPPTRIGDADPFDIEVQSLIALGVGPVAPDPKDPPYLPQWDPYGTPDAFFAEANKFHRTSAPLNAYSMAVDAANEALDGELQILKVKLASTDDQEREVAWDALQEIVRDQVPVVDGTPLPVGDDTRAAVTAIAAALPDELRKDGRMQGINLTDRTQIWTFKLFYSLAYGIAHNKLNVS